LEEIMKIAKMSRTFLLSLLIAVIAVSIDAGMFIPAQAAPVASRASAIFSSEDPFNSATLNPVWHWYREDPSHWSLTAAPGYLRIMTQPKDTWAGSENAPLLLRPVPPSSGENFAIQTRVRITPTENFHQGGLIVYADDPNSVRFTYAYINGPRFEFAKEVAGNFQPIQVAAPAGVNNFHLRITKQGTDYVAHYSQDGINWSLIGAHQNVNLASPDVGLLALNGVGWTLVEIPADFDYFRLTTFSFKDVVPTYWAWDFVERLYAAGITGGCGSNPLAYCPESTVTRAQMAVFLLRGIHGSSYNPPAAGSGTGFTDVAPTYWSAAWIKQLAAEGITGGCATDLYCPESPVTRAQMAVFLLRSKYGAAYTPPAVGASTGFTDVDPTYWASAWIKQLVAEGITSGCGAGTYCPEAPVTRAQMAVFLVKTFNLP
jgi:regulation of enolase protein 1 (concanavalin A-like superfamily)